MQRKVEEPDFMRKREVISCNEALNVDRDMDFIVQKPLVDEEGLVWNALRFLKILLSTAEATAVASFKQVSFTTRRPIGRLVHGNVIPGNPMGKVPWGGTGINCCGKGWEWDR